MAASFITSCSQISYCSYSHGFDLSLMVLGIWFPWGPHLHCGPQWAPALSAGAEGTRRQVLEKKREVPIWSDTKYATNDIQELCDKVKSKVEGQTGMDYEIYKALFYRVKNIVHHYLIKYYVGDDNDYLHLWVFRSFSTDRLEIDLMGVQQQHKWDDPLKPFDEN
ncbi:PREDICTED: cystatin-A-like [Cyprinodon variegatus]|uniref:cystatin-A-like n=1 Tax=Cyprinodon variegatus TaxID=28743 RepID=UPI000742CCE1|nr:PREDICTED: cystatin-A-like [Cyprinodon variegatus]